MEFKDMQAISNQTDEEIHRFGEQTSKRSLKITDAHLWCKITSEVFSSWCGTWHASFNLHVKPIKSWPYNTDSQRFICSVISKCTVVPLGCHLCISLMVSIIYNLSTLTTQVHLKSRNPETPRDLLQCEELDLQIGRSRGVGTWLPMWSKVSWHPVLGMHDLLPVTCEGPMWHNGTIHNLKALETNVQVPCVGQDYANKTAKGETSGLWRNKIADAVMGASFIALVGRPCHRQSIMHSRPFMHRGRHRKLGLATRT